MAVVPGFHPGRKQKRATSVPWFLTRISCPKLKKDRDMPFTFSEYLDYWLNDVCAQGSNGSRTLVQKQWTINLIIQPHLHKDILLGCVTPDYLNRFWNPARLTAATEAIMHISCCIVL